MKFEFKDTIPFTLAPPQNKTLRYKGNEIIQDLYEENHKTLVKKIKNKINGEMFHVHS